MNIDGITKAIKSLLPDEDGYIIRHKGANRRQRRESFGRAKKSAKVVSGRGAKTTGRSSGPTKREKRKTAQHSQKQNRVSKSRRNVRREHLRKAACGKKAQRVRS